MAIFFEDTFTDTDGQSIASHTPDTGTGWTTVNGNNWQIDNNRAAPAGDFDHILADDLPATADYDVQADYIVIGSLTNFGPGVSARALAASANNDSLQLRSTSSGLSLIERDASNQTTLGTYAHTWVVGTAITVKLELRGTTVKVYVDGVERISATTGITDARQAGMYAAGSGTNNLDGMKLDNYSVANPDALSAPTDVVASNPTATTMDLTWTDTNGGTAFPRLYRRTPAGSGDWTFVEQLADAAATSYTFTGLASATQYDFGVSYSDS